MALRLEIINLLALLLNYTEKFGFCDCYYSNSLLTIKNSNKTLVVAFLALLYIIL